VGYYAACAISRVAPDKGIKPIMGYLVSIAIGIVIVAAVPWLSTGFLK
jgi:TRAP-type C4-dicarboxylate transport system permease large subunit